MRKFWVINIDGGKCFDTNVFCLNLYGVQYDLFLVSTLMKLILSNMNNLFIKLLFNEQLIPQTSKYIITRYCQHNPCIFCILEDDIGLHIVWITCEDKVKELTSSVHHQNKVNSFVNENKIKNKYSFIGINIKRKLLINKFPLSYYMRQ